MFTEEPKARANKTFINFMILILIFVENCLQSDAIHEIILAEDRF